MLSFFNRMDTLFWGYIGFVLILLLGIFLTIRTGFFQVREFPSILRTFREFFRQRSQNVRGVHPLKAFFASVGGMIGIGNVVGIVTAVQIGGPGALFWVWVTAFIGSIIKYAEIYLGLTYRVRNQSGGYDGGPIYYLKAAFKSRLLPIAVAILLCIYGVEIYQFRVIADSLSKNWHVNQYAVIAGILILVLYAGIGGVQRIGKICSLIMPFFIIGYLLMGFWIIIQEVGSLPKILQMVFQSAFQGHAAIGGFAGGSVLLAIQHGMSRAAYSADLGIGYDSIIQSESSTIYPEKQASLAVLGVFIDNIVCSISILIVLITGLWMANPPIDPSLLIQTALSGYFPFMQIFMPLFIFSVGYTTIIAYFGVGMKCAKFLAPRYGEKIFIFYAIASFVFFSFFDQSIALLVMSLSGAMLLCSNLLGIFRLRGKIAFPLSSKESQIPLSDEGVL